MPKIAFSTILFLTALAGTIMTTFPNAGAGGRHLREIKLMGTWVRLESAAHSREKALREMDVLTRVLESAEAELSTWRKSSELGRVNAHPVNEAMHLSPRSCRLLADLLEWNERTNGTFDPAVGNLVDAWGLRTDGKIPSECEVAEALRISGLGKLKFQENTCRITKLEPVLLDAGAFGKGAALDRAIEHSRRVGHDPWLINLGGQVATFGVPSQGFWEIALASPDDRSKAIMPLRLKEGSVATSGSFLRDRWVGTQRVGHILDPRSGRPAVFTGTVTVFHPTSIAADILSTALFVMGPEIGLKWAREEQIAVCFLPSSESGKDRVLASESFKALFGKSLPPLGKLQKGKDVQ